jgi:hypothetical protein
LQLNQGLGVRQALFHFALLVSALGSLQPHPLPG